MGKSNCAVIGCANSSYRLVKWKKSLCETHKHQQHEACGCPEPFRLYCFPGPKRYKEQRDRWIKAVKREKKGKNLGRLAIVTEYAQLILLMEYRQLQIPTRSWKWVTPNPRNLGPGKKWRESRLLKKEKNQVALNLKWKPSLQKLQSKKTRKL
eukprot:gene10037-18675_t